jgi:hypothetical protein
MLFQFAHPIRMLNILPGKGGIQGKINLKHACPHQSPIWIAGVTGKAR